MSNNFLKEFDDLLDQILVDYGNLDSAPDVTVGSITYIKAACLASCLWGIYRYQDYLAKQIFVDTCDTDNLNHHGSIYGIARAATDTDAQYLQKILTFLRQPPAGGSKLDYENWALSVPGVTGPGYTGILGVDSATVITPDDGLTPGSVSVTIMPTDDSQLGLTAMSGLVQQTYNYIDSVRPVTANALTVQAPSRYWVDVAIVVTPPTGVTLDLSIMTDDITAFFDALKPGDPVNRSKLAAICIQDGAENANVVTPATDITADKYHLNVLNSLSVTL